MSDKTKSQIKSLIPYIVIIISVILIRTFIATPVQVDGASMYPTLNDKEILILKKYDKSYDRFDIVVFDYNNVRLIKRIIGLPGDTVSYRNNKLYINGKYVEEPFLKDSIETTDFDITKLGVKEIPKGYYFVLGDNRTNSTDSRIIGLVSEKDIKGTTNFAVFPINDFGKIDK